MSFVEFNGSPSWSLNARETRESTKHPWIGVVELIAWRRRAEKM